MEHVVVGGEALFARRNDREGRRGPGVCAERTFGAVVKLYNSRLRIDREEKVRAMVHGGFAAQTDLVGLPKGSRV